MQRIFLLRDLVLFERFLPLTEKAKTIAQIGSHIGIVGAGRDRLLVVRDRLRPILPIVVPVAQCARRFGRRELRNVRRFRGRRGNPLGKG